MDTNNFVFKVPPPPPPMSFLKKPPPPPLPTTAPPILQPPPPPPPTTTPSWVNWTVDFSRPPPPVLNNTNATNDHGQLGHDYMMRQTSIHVSTMSHDNSSHYRTQDNSRYNNSTIRQAPVRRYGSENYLGNQQSWPQRSNFKKQRYDCSTRNDHLESGFTYNVDSRYNRNSLNSDPRYSSYPRTSNIGTNNSNNDPKYNEEGTYRAKKRKKPLSQAVPAKKAWTEEEAQMAIDVEREYNKLLKNHSLKIKFPDQELNRDIVSKFHSSIETVYFQQPSNPRFCFVTLADGADPNTVIDELNKITFGLGYLSAEYKKDREEEQTVGPEDVDPLTLYVGNLAQSVTKVDMVKFYPTSKRIDIGFAKKMKYTRYAFVSFKNVHDSIEAFKATHSANLHSKSMIVRFRRLHGTVGMPGEAKIQNTSKETYEEVEKRYTAQIPTTQSNDTSASLFSVENHEPEVYITQVIDAPNYRSSRTMSESSDSSFDVSLVKSEPCSFYDDSSDDTRSDDGLRMSENASNTSETCSSSSDSQLISVLQRVKSEPDYETTSTASSEVPSSASSEVSSTDFPVRPFILKVEPHSEAEPSSEQSTSSSELLSEEWMDGVPVPKTEVKNENFEPVDPDNNEEEFNTSTDFGSVLSRLQGRPSFIP